MQDEASADDLTRVANVVCRAHHLPVVRGTVQENVLPQAWYDDSLSIVGSPGVPHERHWIVRLWGLVGGGTPEMNILARVPHLNKFGCLLHADIHRVESDDLTHGAVEVAHDTSAVVYGFRLDVGNDARGPGDSIPLHGEGQDCVRPGNGVRVVTGHGDSESGRRRNGGREAGSTNHGKRLPPRQPQVSKRLLLHGYGVSGPPRRLISAVQEGDIGPVHSVGRLPQKRGIVVTPTARKHREEYDDK